MRRRGKSLSAWLVASSFLFAMPVRGEMEIFPMWTVLKCPTEEFACYDMPQTKKIMNIDLSLQLRLKEFENCLADRSSLQLAIDKHKEAAEKDKQQIERLDTRLKEKDQVLVTTTEELKKAESRSIVSWLPWLVGGTLILLIGSFAGGILVGAS
jgi:hypothetical protein